MNQWAFRHSARIDRQLAGHAARRGGPDFFVAPLLHDDAIISKPSKRLIRVIAAYAVQKKWQTLARLAMRGAQRAAEREHAGIRRALLKSDDGLDHALAFTGTPE